jgi:peptidoglycan hydrolase-like protein with peptidoglycan-binding domain
VARKSGQSRKAQPAQGDGVVADLIDRVFENPASSGGLMVVALTATAIVSNAMFLQNGHHPDPLFWTRPAATRPAAKPVAVARPAPVAAQRQQDTPPLVLVPLPRPSPQRAAPATSQPPQPSAEDVAAQLTTAIQRELARLGLYQGAIDGKQGPRTSAAISAYEHAAGLAVTGLPTPALLGAMRQPLPAPMPKPRAAIDNAAQTDSIAEAAALDQREQERAASIAAARQSEADLLTQQNYRIVQAALNRIGYGPLAVDGQASPETADAIRRFELEYGLPIEGEATDELIKRMIAIGAIKPT